MAAERLLIEEGLGVPISRHPVAARALLAQIAAKHGPTYRHMTRVATYAEVFATHLRLSRREVRLVSQAALLHDIGKLEISETILTKPTRLTDDEMRTMCSHAELGAQILARSALLSEQAEVVRYHHEWYNGKGYPTGLAGDQIPWASRMISICDAFDTMTTPRPYATPLLPSQALEELERCAGNQFDPGMVETFVGLVRNGGLKRWPLAPMDFPGRAYRPEPLALRYTQI